MCTNLLVLALTATVFAPLFTPLGAHALASARALRIRNMAAAVTQYHQTYSEVNNFDFAVTTGGEYVTNGEQPYAGVAIDSAGNMYGTAYQGGANGCGSVWEVTSSGIDTGYLPDKDLHDFGGTVTNAEGVSGPDGSNPVAGVTFDTAGDMFGAAVAGGANDVGMVWEITASGVYKDLHDFGGAVVNADGVSGPDGTWPVASVTFDSAGDMYGTAQGGGADSMDGMVWEITASGAYKDLHDFGGTVVNADGASGRDGYSPDGGVSFDSSDDAYGTTYGGGAIGGSGSGGGIVWEITASGVYKDLHDFGGTVVNADGASGPDGSVPIAGVTCDSAVNLYGTASAGGGNSGHGMVWEITASGAYKDLHDFGGNVTNANGTTGQDGTFPIAGVALDSAGDLLGTTTDGGPNVYKSSVGDGMIWEITAAGVYEDRHDFGGTVAYGFYGAIAQDGYSSNSNITFDSAGNMYGTTAQGGDFNRGTTWKLLAVAPAPVSFVGVDRTTLGNWKGVYGGDGWNVIGDTSANNPSYPSYATVTPNGASTELWSSLMLDPAALQSTAAGSANRVAGAWNQTSWSMNVTVTRPCQIALYIFDLNYLDTGGESIILSDTATGTVLDARSGGYAYYVWDISGNVTITFNAEGEPGGPSSAVLNGIFFGPGTGSTAPAAPSLTATPGNAQVSLSWTAPTAATSYNIYRGTTSGGESSTPIATGVTGSSYIDTNVDGATAYYYEVVAVNAVGGSFASNEAPATVPGTTSSTWVTCSPSPSSFGQTVTITATVTGQSPTGTVQFNINNSNVGPPVTLTNGTATYTTSTLVVSAPPFYNQIQATYSGDGYNSASWDWTNETVNQASTSTSAALSPNPSTYGQTVTITATVTGQSPTGTVQFTVDGSNAGSPVTLTNGTATYSTSTLSEGVHSIKASYSGDVDNLASTSTSVTQTVLASTTTSISSSPNPSIYGQSVTLTASVTGASPTGTVQFSEFGENIGSPVTLTNGTATYTTSALPTGSYFIGASYSGDANNGASSSTVAQTVNHASSTTAVTSSPNPSTYGQTVTITATVTGQSPTGSVEFTIDGTNAGLGSVSNGTATFTTSTLSVGKHTIKATYNGDENNTSSTTSTSVTQTVIPASSSVVVSLSPTTSTYGQTVSMTANVVGQSPTGTVQFVIDGKNAGSAVTLTNGTGTYSTSTLTVGQHSITAVYSGDIDNTGSTSSSVTETVKTSSSVSFVNSDSSTQGNWKGIYGADGWNVIGDTSGNNPTYPAYASVAPGSRYSGIWSASSLSPAALQSSAPGSANRIAGVWYQTSWSMNVDVTGTHQLALYLLDINNDGFAETITVKDTASGTVLDTQSALGFSGGVYYIWNVSGNVTMTFTSTAGHWAVLSGIFFGGSGTTAPSAPALGATGSAGQIALTWSASGGATSYDLYRGTTAGGESTTPIAAGLTGTSYTNTGLTNGTTYYYKVVAVSAVGGSFASSEASATPHLSSSVSFVNEDTSTQGNWKGVYGADGWNVIGDTSSNNPTYPTYGSAVPGSRYSGIWAASSLSPAALQSSAPGSANRLAGVWYQTSWSMNVDVTGTHQLALYLLDINNDGFTETITVKDAATGTVLDSRSASGFSGGVYYVWNVSGNVTITFTSTAGHWAVLSGIFFGGSGTTAPSAPTLTATGGAGQVALTWSTSTGATSYNLYRGTTTGGESTTPIATGLTGTSYTNTGLTNGTTYYYKLIAVSAVGGSFASSEASATSKILSSATYVGEDRSTQGNWKGTFGADGWNVIGDTSSNNPTYPTYASIASGSHYSGIWTSSSTNPACLEEAAVGSTSRIAGVWYQTSWSMNVDVTGTHQLALYLLDINNDGFAETITIKDAASGTVLDTRPASSLVDGVYEVWNVSGDVTITFTSTAAHWAVLNGIFFGT